MTLCHICRSICSPLHAPCWKTEGPLCLAAEMDDPDTSQFEWIHCLCSLCRGVCRPTLDAFRIFSRHRRGHGFLPLPCSTARLNLTRASICPPAPFPPFPPSSLPFHPAGSEQDQVTQEVAAPRSALRIAQGRQGQSTGLWFRPRLYSFVHCATPVPPFGVH